MDAQLVFLDSSLTDPAAGITGGRAVAVAANLHNLCMVAVVAPSLHNLCTAVVVAPNLHNLPNLHTAGTSSPERTEIRPQRPPTPLRTIRFPPAVRG